ncbi:MAG: hypothetical protein JKY65_20995 [Planctomycetes bacterium]|nr:hypothetical protein [Planctomycetota bacterium]
MRALTLLAALAFSSGCYASNVVEASQRTVKETEVVVSWTPATVEDLPGFYASSSIEGEAAGALLKAYYYFGAEGSYSGAVLIVSPEGPRFWVLEEDGNYALSEEGLDLNDGAEPVPVDAAPGKLRLRAPGSTIVFERVELR